MCSPELIQDEAQRCASFMIGECQINVAIADHLYETRASNSFGEVF